MKRKSKKRMKSKELFLFFKTKYTFTKNEIVIQQKKNWQK